MDYLLTFVGLIISIPVFLVGFLYTEYTFEKFSEELTSIQAPQDTKLLDSVSEFGNVGAGNGDHCDYLAGTIFETEAGKEQVENYFQSEYKGEGELGFIWLDESNEYTDSSIRFNGFYPLRDLINKNPSSLLRGIVYIYKDEATLDLRCAI